MATQVSFPTATLTAAVAPPETAEDWTTPDNILADDAAESTITADTFDTGDISFWLIPWAFGFDVPATATIDGITVEVEQRCTAGGARDYRVQLYERGVGFYEDGTGGENKATVTAWPGTVAVATYGGATDDWGINPTPALVNDQDFAVVVSVEATADQTDVAIDFVRVTVHYTEDAGTDWVEPMGLDPLDLDPV